MYLKIGFTGTRLGMSIDQSAELRKRLSRSKKSGDGGTTWTMFSEFHHGDCVGADEEAHDMMSVMISRNWPLRVDIWVHPPKDYRWRAGCGTTTEDVDWVNQRLIRVLPEKRYLERDRDIVDATDMLIACPAGFDERGNSGTWYTVRYARLKVRPILLIWPDGSFTEENFDLTPGERREMSEALIEADEMRKNKRRKTKV